MTKKKSTKLMKKPEKRFGQKKVIAQAHGIKLQAPVLNRKHYQRKILSQHLPQRKKKMIPLSHGLLTCLHI